ncbi:2-oxo acid dehydrogenase subunit E2 [Agromyces kandeliae]|uniref:Dihydrolipoamide acetyltransferase component of pyruvate dehydrogenase complex n=1 Tax=Agromyces kandeliae TaxID=2666141 RepID=A0A6L5R0J1_9MICO|nr:2-oxo acid dehydrogenase subunit E2 [Agromyces kandeliae]MRX43483.1 biotin/lipoyl-binding protein [Agromyces kandeliae]
MPELLMPSLGADMEHGKVVEWLVKPGDYVHRGDLVAEVDTEKTVMEIESFEEGVVAEYLVELGETVPVGTPIARVTGTPADGAIQASSPGAAVPGSAEDAVEVPAIAPPIRSLAHRLGVDVTRLTGTGRRGAVTRADVEAAAADAAASGPVGPDTSAEGAPARVAGSPSRDSAPVAPPVARAPASSAEGTGRVRSSPRARRLAADLGLDLSTVAGTAPGGAVTEADVRRATEPRERPEATTAAAPATTHRGRDRRSHSRPGGEDAEARDRARASGPSVSDRVASLRRAIGSLMARSKREIPHYYLSTTIDLGPALEWMRRANAGRPLAERLVPAALLLAASARAARDVPEVNGFFVDGEFRQSSAVHLGVAIALRGGGLVAPAIHDADRLTPDEVMASLRDLVARARAGRLHRAEMADPTITVTNLGELGVETVFGVIYPPQVALVGFGRVIERPWARDGLLGVRPVVTATLSADHRVSDGLRGGRFLARVDELLQRPEEL